MSIESTFKDPIDNLMLQSSSSSSIISQVIPKQEKYEELSLTSEFNDEISWAVIDKYFSHNPNYQLLAHQIESFNDCLENKIPEIIERCNRLSPVIQTGDENRVTVKILFKNVTMRKPVIIENSAATKPMFPNEARLRNFTYSSAQYADLHITIIQRRDGKETETMKIIPQHLIGKIPIMVRSKYCILSDYSHIPPRSLSECAYDHGGYFIINGGERALIAQERMAENYPYCYITNKQTSHKYICEVMSVPQGDIGNPKRNSVKIMGRKEEEAHPIRVALPKVKADIPLFVLFRALGIESDKDIMEFILLDVDQKKNRQFLQFLKYSLDAANDLEVYTKDDAIEYLTKYIASWATYQPHPKSWYVIETLKTEVLPHVGHDFRQKAFFLGFMVNRLLLRYFKYFPLDDRDSYINKRVDLPGLLLANLYKTNWTTKFLKDVSNALKKEIDRGQWKASGNIDEIISPANIYKIVKSTTMEASIKYAMATGNFGMKNTTNKVGISQVLSRLNYNAMISHLRRVNTPIDKTAKLVAPRKLHSTQWGGKCPSETPEGHAVGVTKNLSSGSTVSIGAPTDHIIMQLESIDDIYFLDKIDSPTIAFLKTKIFVNSNWIAITDNPQYVYNLCRHLKRSGIWNPFTGVYWDIMHEELRIQTDSGRDVRPMFIVESGNKLRISPEIYNNVITGKCDWHDLLCNTWTNPDFPSENEGVIEYIDPLETEGSMIAMNYNDLNKDWSPDIRRYTHMEIHPSLILGTLAGSIPFCDHNQAPRNTYQCLWENEKVLMADHTWKLIKNVRVGDRVITFNPQTMITSETNVVHQYVRATAKPIFKLRLMNGFELIATGDHKLATPTGWCEIAKMRPRETAVGVYLDIIDDKPAVAMLEGMCEVRARCAFVPVNTITPHPSVLIADITVAAESHSFITTGGICTSNSAMGKQAMGIFATNYLERMDTMGNVLCYPQRQLISPRLKTYFHGNELPAGINAIVAIQCFTGYNQEDSVLLNKGSVDRGLFRSFFFRTYKDEEKKNTSTGEEERFTRPDHKITKGKKYGSYDKIGADGFVPPETYVDMNDIIIGKVAPIRYMGGVENVKKFKDMSKSLRNNESGWIDRNYMQRNGDGYYFVKTRVRSERIPTIGDKFASSAGQKGTCGMLIPPENMPFTASGLTPDLIMNPHAVPSRMTIGQLVECVMGKACTVVGSFGDATPFRELNLDDLSDLMESCGMEKYGNEIMYNGHTGEMINTLIFMGPTFYQRLKHMVDDKQHSRASGPIVMLTRQPAEGRLRDGGLRFGEMERDCMIAHGATNFTKERMYNLSDKYHVFVCQFCGIIATVNEERKLYMCKTCNNTSKFKRAEIPYGMKLLIQELESMCIASRFIF